MTETAIYTIVVAGKPKGPYTIEELKSIGLKSTTFVRKPDMDDYKEAHAIEELRELFNLKVIQTAPQYFAAFDLRLVATAIDYLAVTMGYLLVILLSFIFIKDNLGRVAMAISFIPVIPIVKFIYSCIAEASEKQGTIGKQLANIKVTDMMGNRITFAVAVGRNLSKVLSALPLFFGYLYSFLNKRQQCWHDIIADTLVVKDRLL